MSALCCALMMMMIVCGAQAQPAHFYLVYIRIICVCMEYAWNILYNVLEQKSHMQIQKSTWKTKPKHAIYYIVLS